MLPTGTTIVSPATDIEPLMPPGAFVRHTIVPVERSSATWLSAVDPALPLVLVPPLHAVLPMSAASNHAVSRGDRIRRTRSD